MKINNLTENELYIGMQVTSKEYGLGIINNIWEFKNNKYLSLKIENKNKDNPSDQDYIFYQYKIKEALENLYLTEENYSYNKHGIKQCNKCGKEIYEYLHITYQNNEEKIFCTECADLEDIMDFRAINNLKHKCLICNNEIEINSLFCKDCYNKYNKKSIFLKVNNLSEISYFDEADKYENSITYTCKDGHKVRSKAEREIDNYLYEHNIRHAYEKPYPIDDNPDNDLHPDFYLPDLDVYIEHWGLKNKSYEEEKKYKMQIYKKNKTTIIETTEEDMKDIETNLTRKLKFYK